MHLTGLAVVGLGSGLSMLIVAFAMSRLLDADLVRELLHEDLRRFEAMLAAIALVKIAICVGLLCAQRWAWILALAACAVCFAISVTRAVQAPSTIGTGLLAFVAPPFLAYLLLRADTRAYCLGKKERTSPLRPS